MLSLVDADAIELKGMVRVLQDRSLQAERERVFRYQKHVDHDMGHAHADSIAYLHLV